MKIDIDLVAQHMRETAAAVILPRFRALDAAEVREKSGPKDLVTIADLEAEARLTPLLQDLLPGSVVVGEEACEKDPGRLALLAGDAPVWVVDPVDGTLNFAKGDERFCSMVALVHRDELVAGWILDPVADRWFVGERGAGAWRYGPDGRQGRLAMAESAPLDQLEGAFNFRFVPEDWRGDLRTRADAHFKAHKRIGCAGQEYMRLLQQDYQFACWTINMPWDHGAGALMVAEAGGHLARFDGRAYRPSEITGGLLIAPDRACWADIRQNVLAEAGALGANQVRRGF
ncbi:MAG: inositol monophosphatase [Pseudomonadota bacterium]|nr:inositol monophosphatase [Pseudomonadota bacterium]